MERLASISDRPKYENGLHISSAGVMNHYADGLKSVEIFVVTSM
jgi:hypothetical protein